jgi:hypothetical protein|nr:sulfite exporter TauE/SafE family protein [uncultured Rhodopila sp.]
MNHVLTVAGLIGCVSLLYATAGQAGGTAFLAVMAFAEFPAAEMRPTALLLNIVAAGYSTWRLHKRVAIDLKMLFPLTVPSLVTAFLGGLLVLGGHIYFILTGVLLIAAAVLMVFKRTADNVDAHPIRLAPAAAVGAGTGFISGLTGVGGGIFLTPLLIAFGWTSPRRAAQLSPPFILCNSVLGLAGVLLAGQNLAPSSVLYAAGALAGAVIGTIIGSRWMSDRGTRYVLAAILVFAGIRLLFR